MNHFISLRLIDGGSVAVRPEAILAVETFENDYQIVRTVVNTYEVEPGQFKLDTLINHTGHAGVRVLD